MFKYLFATCLIATTVQLIESQGPVPPRLSIPGAVPVIPQHPQIRYEKPIRLRRPTGVRSSAPIPQAPTRSLQEDKPVTESTEDHNPDIFLPQLLREQQLVQAQQTQFHQQANAFFNSDPNSVQDHSLTDEIEQQTPQSLQRGASRPAFNDYGIGRFAEDRQSPLQPAAPNPNVVRNRPQYEAPIQAAPPRVRQKIIQQSPIIKKNNIDYDRDQTQTRRQQAVAQTIRKWREENEDGSITWGYENDDGSFKEELIGMDCVTKGTYGYVDPDGNKREYHYETGIKCDPNTRETEEESFDNGYVNYDNNKAVLPNGLEFDMAQLGKKKSKRPGAFLRN